ncbi:MAG: hypothetical protein I3273_07170 [Candidatus Moeniiplasma glomeromycotorum]|nr:hypothetical protein [Candidatus Moeniiplasma glomeromycotorum]MCE8168379.1 hypothetical protein [Candidatus Moeniiplasma glomeromycotorum]MCE8169867.1 hypothetical protein [Candidatus Moeniiplasma glomeromycotorum]
MKNEKIEKLKNKFLTEEVIIECITCQQSCDCCTDTLGCTKWKKIKTDRSEKVKKEIQNLETKKENLKEELKKTPAFSEQEKIREEIELINKRIKEMKESKSERVKNFTIRLREDPDEDTIAHEFTHVFLIYHYNFGEHHGKGVVDEKNSPHFWSLKEWFLREIKE